MPSRRFLLPGLRRASEASEPAPKAQATAARRAASVDRRQATVAFMQQLFFIWFNVAFF